MFDNFSHRLEVALKTLKGQGRITDVNVATTTKEIRKALLDADVNYKIAQKITNEIREEALGQKVLVAIKPAELFKKIVNDKLAELMGQKAAPFSANGSPAVVLIAGLQGSGKTTFSSKLANLIKKKGKQVLLAACDIYRPAAIEQLHTLGDQIGVDVYSERENKNAVEIAHNAVKYGKNNGKNVIIIDTAGRLAVDEQMMNEITDLKKTLKPTETLFVVDSMMGQDAVNTAKTFNERLDFDGVVLTKLDGDSRGGAALSIRMVVDKPIKFISTGEKPEDLDIFHPDRMANRILGMGDVVSLVEKAQESFEEEEVKRINRKISKNQLDFNDLLSQIKQVKKMGNIKDLIGMMPGMNKAIKDVDIDENAFVPIEAIINSMTPFERKTPTAMNKSRKKRIVGGSGTSVQEVDNLIKQLNQLQKMAKQMQRKQSGSLRRMFSKKKRKKR